MTTHWKTLTIGLSVALCATPALAFHEKSEWRTVLKCDRVDDHKADPKIETKVLDLLRIYAPQGYHAIESMHMFWKGLCSRPSHEFMQWVKTTNERRMIGRLPIVVHESMHIFSFFGLPPDIQQNHPERIESRESNGELEFLFREGGRHVSIYLKDWGFQYIGITKTFPSKEIATLFQGSALKKGRYPTYISPAPLNLSTQTNGIYGLLNEFHAYYHQFLTEENLRKGGKTPKGSYSDSFISFLEFKLYTLRYIQTAKRKHPDIYDGIMKNRHYIEAFLRIHDRFKVSHDKYITEYIEPSGRIPFEDRYKAYLTELARPENIALMKELRGILVN